MVEILAPVAWDKFDRELQPNVVEILAPVTWDKFDRELKSVVL